MLTSFAHLEFTFAVELKTILEFIQNNTNVGIGTAITQHEYLQ